VENSAWSMGLCGCLGYLYCWMPQGAVTRGHKALGPFLCVSSVCTAIAVHFDDGNARRPIAANPLSPQSQRPATSKGKSLRHPQRPIDHTGALPGSLASPTAAGVSAACAPVLVGRGASGFVPPVPVEFSSSCSSFVLVVALPSFVLEWCLLVPRAFFFVPTYSLRSALCA